ncbi:MULTISPECIES: toxin-antitoxin system TumE family protein [Brevibacillus]|jgi:hypothetical protein|uniref:toxin-antitoxin system TumE family protein n=1 Tax=Brevibacillus TaxID=55080 RepID=UPI00156ABF75|nr:MULTISPECIES: DUF6516 family protein [Brevibacillus]MBU8715980.1 hypothetical protein [Brevibacillus parabrevis]MDH6353091.1 hypothetical protein [Brevibacillus sp. 1238]MDR5002669.1 DUF6516 family protein [Brevibacillus parabrevis]MED1723807.1 DUF6516 family protein [Brevibacillus parabrevis]MED2256980.1 DUF6516 family protein [Brevibacillus parabrevis]
MIGNPATNLEVLKKTFGHAIQFIRNTDSTGMPSSIYAQRATIVFSDSSKLYVTEKLNKQQCIEEYWYDWIAADDKTVLGKYHGEPHEDESYQTATEPYHVHPPEYAKLTNQTRFPNYYYNDLFSIVEGIFLFYLLPNRSQI